MVRSLWKRTLVTSLAWAGLAWAQQPVPTSQPASSPAPVQRGERVITLQEPGRSNQKCKIVRTWQTAEGATAYQVQALDTSEIMTIVESGPATTIPGSRPGTRMQAMATRIFHWGQSSTSPKEAPTPPVEVVQPMPAPMPRQETVTTRPVRPEAASVIVKQETQTFPVTQPEQKPQRHRLFSFLHKDEDVTPTTTVVTTPPKPVAVNPPAESTVKKQPVVTQPVSSATITPSVTAASTSVTAPSVMSVPSEPRKDAGERLVQLVPPGNENTAAVVPEKNPVEVKPMLPTAKVPDVKPPTVTAKVPDVTAPPAVKTPVTPAPATDWRKSWGKTDDSKSTAQSKPQSLTADVKTTGVSPSLPQADSKRPDPLQIPDRYSRRPLEEKPSTTKPDTDNGMKTSSWNTTVPAKSGSTMTASGTNAVTTQANGAPMTAGLGSVMGASDGTPGAVRYIPVPIVTVPDLAHPPVAPMPRIPQPPQLAGQQNNGAANVYVNKPWGPAPTTSDEAMTNAFTSMPSNEAVARATNAFTSPDAGSMATGGMAAPQAVYPRNPYGAMAQAVPAGGMPAGMGRAVVPAGYQAAPSYEQARASQGVSQMQTALRDSLYPSQREWAAESLATVDWRTNPQVVEALLTAARNDPAATVRAACVRCLCKMNVNTLPVVTTVQSLKTDPDPRVRQEVDQALMVLVPSSAAPLRQSVLPTSGR
jgi:hypothetical protein